MPKVVDRSKWILLPAGQNQTGWLENSGATVYGCFRTHWRLPDGTERTWRERVELVTPSKGADSEGCRSAFRTDVDHDSEVMPISIPN